MIKLNTDLTPYVFKESELGKRLNDMLVYVDMLADSRIDDIRQEYNLNNFTDLEFIDRFVAHGDIEALAAYYYHFIRPRIGTAWGMRKLFALMGIDVELREWFQDFPFIRVNRFQLVFANYPEVDFQLMLDAIMQFKNERSWLDYLHTAGAGYRFILDYSYLDGSDLLSDFPGVDIDDVKWNFLRELLYYIRNTDPAIATAITACKSQWLPYFYQDFLDYTSLDSPSWQILESTALRARLSTKLFNWGEDKYRTIAEFRLAYPDTGTGAEWAIVGAGDFIGNLNLDLLWRNSSTGELFLRFFDRQNFFGGQTLLLEADLSWELIGCADFNNTNTLDLLWWNSITGQVRLTLLRGLYHAPITKIIYTESDLHWKPVLLMDLNNDKRMDLLWHNTITGSVDAMIIVNTFVTSRSQIAIELDLTRKFITSLDYDGDKKQELFSQNSNRYIFVWDMIGATRENVHYLNPMQAENLQLIAAGDMDHDGMYELVFKNTITGITEIWFMEYFTKIRSITPDFEEYSALWEPIGFVEKKLLFAYPDGTATLWNPYELEIEQVQHSRTYEIQHVLDDYGILSGMQGFVGVREVHTIANEELSNNIILSDDYYDLEPLLILYQNEYAPQEIDTSSLSIMHSLLARLTAKYVPVYTPELLDYTNLDDAPEEAFLKVSNRESAHEEEASYIALEVKHFHCPTFESQFDLDNFGVLSDLNGFMTCHHTTLQGNFTVSDELILSETVWSDIPTMIFEQVVHTRTDEDALEIVVINAVAEGCEFINRYKSEVIDYEQSERLDYMALGDKVQFTLSRTGRDVYHTNGAAISNFEWVGLWDGRLWNNMSISREFMATNMVHTRLVD